MYGRNDRNAFAALSAEEERRRANEEAAAEPHPSAEDIDWARAAGGPRRNRSSKVFAWIRRAFGR